MGIPTCAMRARIDEMVEVAEGWRPSPSLTISYLFASEFEEKA
jgi:hypothetical protein